MGKGKCGSETDQIIEDMAEAGHNVYFDNLWCDLPEKSIERAMWVEVVKNMLRAVKFPGELYKICRDLHFEDKK